MFSQLVKTVRENEPQVFIPGAQSSVVPLSGSAALLSLRSVPCEPDCLRRRLPFPNRVGKRQATQALARMRVLGLAGGQTRQVGSDGRCGARAIPHVPRGIAPPWRRRQSASGCVRSSLRPSPDSGAAAGIPPRPPFRPPPKEPRLQRVLFICFLHRWFLPDSHSSNRSGGVVHTPGNMVPRARETFPDRFLVFWYFGGLASSMPKPETFHGQTNQVRYP